MELQEKGKEVNDGTSWWDSLLMQHLRQPTDYGSTMVERTATTTTALNVTHNNCNNISEVGEKEDFDIFFLDIDDAIERLGMGAFQYDILLSAGLCFMADSMEVLLLSFLAVVLRTEWGLKEHEMDTIISVVFAGAVTGTLVLSRLGDSWGRKPVFTITSTIISVFGILTAFCNSYPALLVTRFMVGFGVGGLTIPFDTLAEFVPTSHRGTNLLQIEIFWTLGTLLVPIFAWLTLSNHDWRLFVVLCAIPCILSTILGIRLVPESPRWLLTQTQTKQATHQNQNYEQQALDILRKAAKRNGLNPYETFPLSTRLINGSNNEHQKQHKEPSLSDLLSPKWRKITLNLWAAWFGLSITYYGAIMAISIVFTDTAGANDDDDNHNGKGYSFDYGAILISASSEIFGLLAVMCTIDKWGRIPTTVGAYLLGGVSCFFLLLYTYYHPSPDRTILVILSFFARMGMMGASSITWVSTSEILVTEIRATGHGAANAVSRLGGFFVPYIISERTPLNIMGAFLFLASIITARVTWNLPETAGIALGQASSSVATSDDNSSVGDDNANPHSVHTRNPHTTISTTNGISNNITVSYQQMP